MAARTGALPTLMVVALGLLLVYGCDKHSTRSADPGDSHNFSVQFDGVDPGQELIWVVLHNLAGDSALAVRRLSAEGLADFGDVHMERVSCSIVVQDDTASTEIYSYLDVPGGAWHVLPRGRAPEHLGEIDVTFHYPTGEYTWYQFYMPGIFGSSIDPPPAEPWRANFPMSRLDNGGFSAYAAIYGEGTDYCGWISQEPFVVGDTNRYTLDITQPLEYRTLSTSQPMRRLNMQSFRGESSFSYQTHFNSELDGSSSWQIPICATAPVDRYVVEVEATEGGNVLTACYSDTDLPTALDIPAVSLEAGYDAAQRAYTNVAVHSTMDFYEAVWSGTPVDSSLAWIVRWTVYTQTEMSEIRMPELGDSVIAATEIHLETLRPHNVTAHEFDTMTSLDNALSCLMCRYYPMNPPVIFESRAYSIRKQFD